jgi:hypothetical protein
MDWVERESIKAEFGHWLSTDWTWDWFCSFTFLEEIGTWKADNMWKKYIKELCKWTGRNIQWVRCTELQQRGVIHYHALFLNVGTSKDEALEQMKRFSYMHLWEEMGGGYSRIYPYLKLASYYLSKYVVKEIGEIKFSDKLQDYAVWTERYQRYTDNQLSDITFVSGMACSLDSHVVNFHVK